MKADRGLPTHLGENKASKCFLFRHPNYHDGQPVYFSYAKGKDRDTVLRKAIQFTRRKNKSLPRPVPRSTAGMMTSRNTSQIVGVSPVRSIIQKSSGREYTYFSWRADWIGCPHAGGVTWPCHAHGCKEAFVLAVLTRALQSVNRRRILDVLAVIRGTDLYRTLVRRKARHEGCHA